MFFFCPDGITPNSGLTGLNNTYTYMSMYNSSIIDIEHDSIIPQNLVHHWLTRWPSDNHKLLQKKNL